MIDYHCNQCGSFVKQRYDCWYVEIMEKDCVCDHEQKPALDAFFAAQGYEVPAEA